MHARTFEVIARAAFDPADEPLAELLLRNCLREQIVAHLGAALPNEGCGLLAVQAGEVREAVFYYPGENLDASPNRFTMNPVTVIAAFKDMEARGWRLGAIVHSHPRTPASPSITDLREAHYPSALMLICSFASDALELRAWAIAARSDGGNEVREERPIRWLARR